MAFIKDATKGRGRTLFRLFSFSLLFLVIYIGISLPLIPALVIRDTQSNQVVWSADIQEDATFGIRWTHSIHRSNIEERYRIVDDQIILSEMSFHDYGIGMENELAPGEELIMADGQFHIRNMQRSFPALRLFIGQVRANHTLLFAGQEIPLGLLDKPGEAITIQAEKRSILSELGGY
ncbi:DUF1850 domain-containing protein [Brevibacillus sp. 179-C9.3 HS]|uniref:DUF1850 domain-containing protein n=1 Tax=unclassified Brevibacillus TaxID=2684853 RepID=UPI0039A263BF